MALSDDGKFHKGDFQQQAKFVAKYIKDDALKILEVGAGKVANTKYLAKRFPNNKFTALDLPNRNFLKTRVPKNVSLIEGDYNDLSAFPGGSFDIVFAVETICHSQSKEKVLRQLSRVLKPSGTLIIFDVYEPLPHSKMTDFQKCVSAITLAGMRVTPNDLYIGDTEKYLKKTGFSDIGITDMTQKSAQTSKGSNVSQKNTSTTPRSPKFSANS